MQLEKSHSRFNKIRLLEYFSGKFTYMTLFNLIHVANMMDIYSRAGIIREKEIHYLQIARPARAGDSAGPEKHFAVVTMNTQAGTYIKEFVHGDLGRTQPNLASLAGAQGADLIELDVMEVDLVWPPKK